MDRGSPIVSVIIPTHNRMLCLGRSIESVLGQAGAAPELIVVDDGSTDGTASWLARNHPEIRVIRHQAARGVAAARNAGLAAGRGTFLAFLDDDDWWDKEFLIRHLDSLKRSPKAVLSFCDYTSVAEDGGSPVLCRAGAIGTDPVETMLMGNPIASTSLVLFRRDALDRAGGFREDYAMCEDRELYLRLLHYGGMAHEPRAMVFKTRSPVSMTRQYVLWAEFTGKLLDDFFQREESIPYRAIETSARSLWSARIALICLRQGGGIMVGLRLAFAAIKSRPLLVAGYFCERLRRMLSP